MATESNTCFGLFISGAGRGISLERLVVVLYTVKWYLAGGLMLKKKLPPLVIELVVILNHLGVIHL